MSGNRTTNFSIDAGRMVSMSRCVTWYEKLPVFWRIAVTSISVCDVQNELGTSYRGADKSLARPDWKNHWKVAIFRPTLRSLLPRRPGQTDSLLNFFWVACKSYSLVAVAGFLPGRAKDLSAPCNKLWGYTITDTSAIPYQVVTIYSAVIHVFPNVSIHHKETQQHRPAVPLTSIKPVDSDALLRCWDVSSKI